MAQATPVSLQSEAPAAEAAQSSASLAREAPKPIAVPGPRVSASNPPTASKSLPEGSNVAEPRSREISPNRREEPVSGSMPAASLLSGTPPPEKSERSGKSILRRMLPGGSKDVDRDKIPANMPLSPRASVSEGTGAVSPKHLDVDGISEPMESLSVRQGAQGDASAQATATRERKNSDASLGSGIRLTAAALRDVDAKSRSEKPKSSGPGSTLRDMIMNAPKISRRGSNASHRSEGSLSGTSAHSSKSGTKESKKKSTKGSASGGEVTSLLKKYGTCERVCIGKGATAVVRIAHKWDNSEEKVYAVKEFRKRGKNESEKDYVKKLTSEFCISSTLHHVNVVETVDLVQDENQHWCEVMEYCPGGDLYGAIKKGNLTQPQIESYFKQTIQGINYLHSMGVAHRDIKPENLLLDGKGFVKITDFGVSDVFRMCWEKSTHYSKGLCGSEPYIAPEQFEQKEYDARLVDVWAAGIVFYCMQNQELPWHVAKMTDQAFHEFVVTYLHTQTPSPLQNLKPRECRPILKKMLCPDVKMRCMTEEILKDPWIMQIPDP
ncbi:hypothetical protein MCUN1_003783 [Malassezia cuniculi]|uniref:non-specific serine/threonine protein kinase n=1 Tax=Malassezia cuniculi TaxID=948313 RepID=A0AAF0F1X3_9BASI|nr:hypothetical protein MCUN1_003783 [Malassezia cuniculi]